MNDYEYVFKQDIKYKKNIGRNIRYMNRTGKGGVKMPSDYLSRKEKNALNGPVNSYDMGKPMTYKKFKSLPEDIRREYLQGLMDKFHPTDKALAELWGVSKGLPWHVRRDLGIANKGSAVFDEDAWDKWIASDPAIVKVTPIDDDPAPVEEIAQPPVLVAPEATLRERILRQAETCVMGDREQDYGTPEQNFRVIADMWNAYLRTDLQPKDVAAMLALLKIARIASGHAKADNWVDLAGYAACGGELEANERTGS